MIYSKLSLMGLYNYDKTIFDLFEVPASVDRDILVQNLMLDTADMEILYPNPNVMKQAIGFWSESRIEAWNHMEDALHMNYNPIHNYDRNEEYTDTVVEKGTSNGTSTTKSSGEATHSVSAFNTAAGLTDAEKNSAKDSGEATSQGATSNDKNIEHKAHLYGNIGVTTTQEMIESELKLRETDMYKIVEREFISKFILLVY